MRRASCSRTPGFPCVRAANGRSQRRSVVSSRRSSSGRRIFPSSSRTALPTPASRVGTSFASRSGELEVRLDLDFGRCRLVVAAREDSGIERLDRYRHRPRRHGVPAHHASILQQARLQHRSRAGLRRGRDRTAPRHRGYRRRPHVDRIDPQGERAAGSRYGARVLGPARDAGGGAVADRSRTRRARWTSSRRRSRACCTRAGNGTSWRTCRALPWIR